MLLFFVYATKTAIVDNFADYVNKVCAIRLQLSEIR